MKTANRWFAIWLSIVCAGALAQEPDATAPASPPPGSPPPSTAPQDAPPAQGAPSQADDVFIPSEEVQAAEELAFPVDI